MNNYHFRNLVFEGGGVKGIAYTGALRELEQRGILRQISRVGGTSAGAITAVLLSLDYTLDEIDEILWNMDFRNFMDDSWLWIRDLHRLWKKFGIYRGNFFSSWMGELIGRKSGHPDLTFAQLNAEAHRDLCLVGANLSRGIPVLFSKHTTPETSIRRAVRISMSLPFFFRSVRFEGDLFVDGGIYQNYPVKIFDYPHHIDDDRHVRETDYYNDANAEMVYNQETLGFRLDTTQEIKQFTSDRGKFPDRIIDSIKDFTMNIIGAVFDLQNRLHLHSDDWQRTIYINTIGVGTTDFDLDDDTRQALVDEGAKGVRNYFDWYDEAGDEPSNKPEYISI